MKTVAQSGFSRIGAESVLDTPAHAATPQKAVNRTIQQISRRINWVL
jgi:L-asparagine transporter-like permease